MIQALEATGCSLVALTAKHSTTLHLAAFRGKDAVRHLLTRLPSSFVNAVDKLKMVCAPAVQPIPSQFMSYPWVSGDFLLICMFLCGIVWYYVCMCDCRRHCIAPVKRRMSAMFRRSSKPVPMSMSPMHNCMPRTHSPCSVGPLLLVLLLLLWDACFACWRG